MQDAAHPQLPQGQIGDQFVVLNGEVPQESEHRRGDLCRLILDRTILLGYTVHRKPLLRFRPALADAAAATSSSLIGLYC